MDVSDLCRLDRFDVGRAYVAFSRAVPPLARSTYFLPNDRAGSTHRAQGGAPNRICHPRRIALARAASSLVDGAKKTFWKPATVTLLVAMIYATTDEFHQSFIPSRTATAHDVMIDIVGAIVGLLICWMFVRNRPAATPRAI